MTHAQMIQENNTTSNDRLYIAFELSNSKWKLAFGNGMKKREKTIVARDLTALTDEIEKARKRFNMADDVPIYSCYEAGRDGFWIHRYLESVGVHNLVVDSSSIEVSRRYRRAKSDRLDANKLLSMLIRYLNGEQKLWSVLRVPGVEEEDARRLTRELERLKKEKVAHRGRIKSLLALHGIVLKGKENILEVLEMEKYWDRKPLPPRIKNEILREYHRYELVQEQIKTLETEKKALMESSKEPGKKIAALTNLKGIGPKSSRTLVLEYFGWRKFKNVKEVGAAAGLAPTPYNSGASNKEQGINKSGNPRVRRTMIELSWLWLRWQPESDLSKWFMKNFGPGKRMRRVGIVALARKLLVSLWKYLETGLVPHGAVIDVA